jgi:heterodisulfide reductase subunit A
MDDAKVAVFICSCNDQIGTNVDLEKLEQAVSSSHNVVSVKRHGSLCTKDGQEFIKNELKDSEANRVVVAACTPRTYEDIIKNSALEAGINKNLYEQTGIREQCEWVHQDKDSATAKAISLVNCAIAKVEFSQAITDEKKQFKNKIVLVIGGGIAGMKAALVLAKKGIKCHIVEREDELGGMAYNLSAGALEDDKSELPAPDEVMNNENIEVHLQSNVKNITGGLGDYHITLESTLETDGGGIEVEAANDSETEVADSSPENENTEEQGSPLEFDAAGIIVATGSRIFDPNRIPEFNYENPDVINSLDLEKMLNTGEIKRPSNDSKPKRINFIQCVGSRDENKGNPHCSLVCCTYAIQQALNIKKLDPEIAVYIHYMDLRGPYPGFEEAYRNAQENGIQFLRGRIAEIQNVDNKLVMRAENVDLGEPFEWESDLIVLSIGQEPNEGNDKLAELLHVPTDIDGFLGEYNYRWDILDRRGISIAGGAQGPRNIKHALSDAIRSANEMAELMRFGEDTRGIHSVVDPSRCTGCGICEALCPYSAITMKNIIDYEMEEVKQVSDVDISTCQGCGACAMACPSNVPVLSHFTADQLLAEIDAVI